MIRKMESQDIAMVALIEKSIFTSPWSEQSFLEEYNKPQNIYLVSLHGDEITGYCGMWGVAGEGQITNVAVSIKYQNQGIGRRLLSELFHLGQQEGLEQFTLEVRQSNLKAIHLYESFGFRIAGVRKDFYSKPRENALIMWK